MSKSAAYVICVSCLMAIFFCLLFTVKDAANLPVSAVITGLVTVTTGFIGLQVTNNGVIGKFYRPELDGRGSRDADAVGVCTEKNVV
jgi:uncharacterized protein (DUF983 family)